MKWFLALLLAFGSLAFSKEAALGSDAFGYTRTNLVDRWITNTALIQMQVNRFVTEFHTNWVKHVETNYVDLFSTNLLTQFHTNWIAQWRTNVVHRFSTNFVTTTATNTVVVEQFRTNFVAAYHTNFQTLNLTNWTTVVAFRTNWVTQPLTNLVDISIPRPPLATAVATPETTASGESLSLQANQHATLTSNHQVEVQLKVSWAHAANLPLLVQEWRVERSDGSILCFGQDLEFKRPLPPGTYKVIVRAQRDAASPLIAALGTLTVTPRAVLLEQRPARSNSAI